MPLCAEPGFSCSSFLSFPVASGKVGHHLIHLSPPPDLKGRFPITPLRLQQVPTYCLPRWRLIPPTPTPIIHIVMEGETLVGIADHYGISLEALQAANPSVQPSALTVGAQIMVPTGGSISGEATPTPAALPILQARCWLETSGGTWCFALLKNEYAETLENISAQFTLRDAGGEEISSKTAYGLLNILPPASAMPLAVYFPPLPSSGDAAFPTQPGLPRLSGC